MEKSELSNENSPMAKKRGKSPPKPCTPLKSEDSNIQYGGLANQQDDVPLLSDEGLQTISKCKKCVCFMSTLTIEPVLFCFMFSYVLNVSSLTNLLMDKGCLYKLNYSEEICNNLSAHPKEKDNVEILANNYALYSNLLNFVGAFTMIFIAPWSDKYGRKLPLFLTIVGSILSDIGLLLCTFHFDSKLEYLLLAKLPSEMFGGFICVLTIVYSHASEVSTEKTRTIKYTTVEIAFALAMSLGVLAGGVMTKNYGYFYLYMTGAIMHLFCVPWVIFVVEETTGLDDQTKWSKKLREFFRFENLKSGFKASFRRREGSARCLLLLYFASMCIIIITYESLGSIGFVYVHHIYNWDLQTYSIVNTIFNLSQLIVILMVVPLLVKVFKVSDPILGITGTLSIMLKHLLFAFAQYHVFVYYLGLSAGSLASVSTLAIRAVISKTVDKDELGRVFSFLATCEAIVPMVGTSVVTKVFNATLDIFPSVSYLMIFGLLFVPLGTFIWAVCASRRKGILKFSISADYQINAKS